MNGMDQIHSRSSIQVDPKLLVIMKQIAQDTGVQVEQLVNLSMYEVAKRLGYVNPAARNVAAPEAIDLLDRAEPYPPPARKPVRQGAPERSAQQGRSQGQPAARKAPGESLFMQVDKSAPIPIRKDVFLIGRGSKCDYIIEHRSVSREHTVITRERNGWFIEDLHSANGTWIDGEQISKHKIEDGDEIQISNLTIRLSIRAG
jgi:hypothetical protein